MERSYSNDGVCDASSKYSDFEKDVETTSANTESCLLRSSQNSSGVISNASSNEDTRVCCGESKKLQKRSVCCGTSAKLTYGFILTTVGILTIIWTPFHVLMHERLKMMPGLPPFEWWKNPPDEVLLKVYIFNITNGDEFLSGNHTKLQVQEIGPIIYREKLVHSNITFNENGTITYVATRTAIYLPEMNTIDLNKTVVLPNLAILGIASYFSDASFFIKFGYNLLVRRMESTPLVKMTIYNYLWNYTDPFLDMARQLAPFLVPVDNMGILERVYADFVDPVTVFYGPEHGNNKFFTLDKFHGSEYLPGYNPNKCADYINGSTEGVLYTQFMTKQTILQYWRKTICRVAPLEYADEFYRYGVKVYRYDLSNNTYDRINDRDDCYVGEPPLPNGLSDASICFFDFPVAASFPHFLYGDDILHTYVDGLTPNKQKHDSYATVEPFTGIPVESRARSQSNLIVRELNGFHASVERFSNTVIPMFWLEYFQVGLPFYIQALMYITVEIIPVAQYFITGILLISGIFLVYSSLRRKYYNSVWNNYNQNKVLQFEIENFLKKQDLS